MNLPPRPKRVWGDWWLCKNNGHPKSQTPKAEEEIVQLRLVNEELKRALRDKSVADDSIWDEMGECRLCGTTRWPDG